jgi:WD40 repeat protein
MQRVIITASKLNNSGIGNSARLSSELATKFGKKPSWTCNCPHTLLAEPSTNVPRPQTMSKYAASPPPENDAPQAIELPPEAKNWSKAQKKEYMNQQADLMVQQEIARKAARLRAEKAETARIAALVKPDDVTAIEQLLLLQDKKIHRNAVYCCKFSPNGERIATCGHDMTIGVWDCIGNSDPEKSMHQNLGSRINQVLKGHSGWVMQVVWSPNSKYLLSCSADNSLKIWDVEDEANTIKWGMCVTTMKAHEDMVTSILWHKDMTRIFSSCRDGTIYIWDATMQLKRFFKKESGDALKKTIDPSTKGNKEGHMDQINKIVFNETHSQFLSCSNDTTMKAWNPRTGKCLMTYEGHTDHVLSAQYSPDKIKIASCSHDKTVRIWDAATGRCMRVLTHHTNIVYDVQYSTYDHGRLLFSVGHDKKIVVYDVFRNYFDAQHVVKAHNCWILGIDISVSNVLIASASGDGACVLWQPMHPSNMQRVRTSWYDMEQCLSECTVQ